MSDRSGSLGISVYREIRRAILLTVLMPGEKLTLRRLTDLYGCGASPIREALNQLATEGWVDRIDKRGFFVAATSREEFADILWNRCFMEGEALRQSIARGDRPWEERVVLAHYRMATTPREHTSDAADRISDWEVAHRAFHLSLISACNSPLLIANCEKLYDLNIRYRFLARRTSYPSRGVDAEHNAIRDHALGRDADRAVEALTAHYIETGRYLFGTDEIWAGAAVVGSAPEDRSSAQSG